MSIADWLPELHCPTGPDQRPRSRLVDPLLRPIVRLLHIETAGGFLLLACTVVALALANSPWSDWFADIWQTRLGFSFGAFELKKPLLLWINDGAMTIFIAGLALSDELLAAGEIGTLLGSALSAVLGLGLLTYCLTSERYRPHGTV